MENNLNEISENSIGNENICDSGNCHERETIRDDKLKSSLISRLNRIEGQVRGIKGMIEKDVYCDDVLAQISAVQSALNSSSKLLLENHIKTCLVTKIKQDDPDIVNELVTTIGKLL